MSAIRSFVAICAFLVLVSCAGVGIIATSDPLAKLNDAEDLFDRQDRPLPAERLIREAMTIYQERGDPHGLGHAYREYGDFLRSPSIAKWEMVFRRDGFRDPSVTFENRLAKASEYYAKALDYYLRAEEQLRGSEKYDSLSNVYVNMAWSYFMLSDRVRACDFLDKSLEAYSENIRRNPSAKPYSSSGTFPQSVESKKKYVGCA